MYQGVGCNKDGTVIHRSSSRIQLVRRTIFSAKLGSTRKGFSFWFRMEKSILGGWPWKYMVRIIRSDRLLQAHTHNWNMWHISMLLTRMITTDPFIWWPSGQSVTILESSTGHCTMFFTLFPNQVLVRVNGRSISIETMAASAFKLILPFPWSTLQLRPNGMATQTVQVGCVNQSFCLLIVECVILAWTD